MPRTLLLVVLYFKQRVNIFTQPLAFFSRKLSETEKGYSAYDRELLATYASIKQFRYMLEARNFILCTHHKPLTYAFKQKLDKCLPRQARQLDFISQFTTDIRHIRGSDNLTADTLSRIASIHMPSPIDYNEITKAQENDSELISLIDNPQGGGRQILEKPLAYSKEKSRLTSASDRTSIKLFLSVHLNNPLKKIDICNPCG
ncbi:transposon Ty3-G Gag-Pol polyprotein [Trichonephila inaurata madagascariensis]|uniref:Transposon Ty3-G Gag-Pol polyprotein n=1 Tax=Trichonephila inaurata madagascariensis TaxID=2747483 RepID=A0A8X7CLW9_9ARAC|nr:transposon Ty3-G Gag-Pol polyprotein [Trichonephila inaurata madagascariensis]